MKRLFCLLIAMLLMSPVLGADVWLQGSGTDSPAGTDSPSDIDDYLAAYSHDPLESMLRKYRQGARLVYASASTLTVEDGGVMVSNSGGTVRAMLYNTSDTTVTWSDIDTGSEATATTYYVYAYCSDPTSDTDFDIAVSTSSSEPSGVTYYRKLGSFVNDASGNITQITNDGFFTDLGTWESKSEDTAYQATTDGFVLTMITGAQGGPRAELRSDGSSSPTTARVWQGAASTVGANYNTSVCCPIKKGDYWEVVTTNSPIITVYWVPLD